MKCVEATCEEDGFINLHLPSGFVRSDGPAVLKFWGYQAPIIVDVVEEPCFLCPQHAEVIRQFMFDMTLPQRAWLGVL